MIGLAYRDCGLVRIRYGMELSIRKGLKCTEEVRIIAG